MILLKRYLGINCVRIVIATLFCSFCASGVAQEPRASEKLKVLFFTILERQIAMFVAESPRQNPLATSEETSQVLYSLAQEAQAVYSPLLTLPEEEATRLLTLGPNDEANMAAMQRNIALWKNVQVPMPALYQKMQTEVADGKIKAGLELELTRRISEFHLRQLRML